MAEFSSTRDEKIELVGMGETLRGMRRKRGGANGLAAGKTAFAGALVLRSVP